MKKTQYVGSGGGQQDFIKMLKLSARYVNRIKWFVTINIFVQMARYAKKGAGYNFCDTILPYHNCE